MAENTKQAQTSYTHNKGDMMPNFTDIQEVKKAFIASEIFNRKY
jgi:hypothetical protein